MQDAFEIDFVLFRIVSRLVDAKDDGDVLPFCWRRNHDLVCAGFHMPWASSALVKRPVDAMTDVDLLSLPGDPPRMLSAEKSGNFLAV